jgi:hypothetical protein
VVAHLLLRLGRGRPLNTAILLFGLDQTQQHPDTVYSIIGNPILSGLVHFPPEAPSARQASVSLIHSAFSRR